MIRIESALILRALSNYDMLMSSQVLAGALNTTLASVNRRTAALYTQRMIDREICYGKSRGERVVYMHITQYGTASLAAYEACRKKRPTKHEVIVDKPRAASRNSIFNNN